jgi:hypothetical protein
MKKVFINYSWQHDTQSAEKIYDMLMAFPDRFDVWMDSKSMEGGLQWRPAIRKAIREADFFIAVLSSGSVVKRGVINQELYEAVDVWKEFPPNQIFLVPARVEECISPFEDLAKMNYVNLFPDWNKGLKKLIATLDKELAEENQASQTTRFTQSLKGLDGLDGIDLGEPTAMVTGPIKKIIPAYHYKIGLVDLDLKLKSLPAVIKQLNATQNYFLFTLPEMPPLKDNIWVIEQVENFYVSKVPASYITRHKHPETDFIACFTGYPLAFDEGDTVLYNYFSGPSDQDERFLFLSADQLKAFSKEAGTRYEEGLVYMLIAQLVCYFTNIKYHVDTRGCVMDFCENRHDIVQGFQKRAFCKECSKELPEGEFKKAIELLLNWNYKP